MFYKKAAKLAVENSRRNASWPRHDERVGAMMCSEPDPKSGRAVCRVQAVKARRSGAGSIFAAGARDRGLETVPSGCGLVAGLIP
jgi:hypothetical protein